MESKMILYFDMDGVLVDFESGVRRLPEEAVREYDGRLDEVPGIFALMDPMPGAIEAVEELSKHYDAYILSTAPWNNPSAWADKVRFVQKYFPKVFRKRLILSHRKDLLRGDFLIDDRPKHGAKAFRGEWIQMGSERFPDWKAVLKYLIPVPERKFLKEKWVVNEFCGTPELNHYYETGELPKDETMRKLYEQMIEKGEI